MPVSWEEQIDDTLPPTLHVSALQSQIAPRDDGHDFVASGRVLCRGPRTP